MLILFRNMHTDRIFMQLFKLHVVTMKSRNLVNLRFEASCYSTGRRYTGETYTRRGFGTSAIKFTTCP